MKTKLIISVVTVMVCLSAIIFGAGFGGGSGEASGTMSVTDCNRYKVFATKADFDSYVNEHAGDLFNVSESERAKYDEAFFSNNALVMFLTDGMSGSIKVQCEGYELVGEELRVTVKELSPAIHTMDLRYNTLTVAIPQELATRFTKVALNSYRVEI